MTDIPKWQAGDWNAYFGFGTNTLVNMLVLTGLLRFGIGLPDELVFGRILPAVGLMLLLSTGYYSVLAYRLAKQTKRSDICALPSGISVVHMFVVVFVIMGPILATTGDPERAWEAGLAWVFIQSIVLMLGSTVAPLLRKVTPRGALLGTLAGVSLTFIAMRPALEIFSAPIIGLLCFVIILRGWFGRTAYFGNLPAGAVAILLGLVVAWGAVVLDSGISNVSIQGVVAATLEFGFYLPLPAVNHVFGGFEFLGILLVTAIPFGIYDLVEATDNVESAAAAGDPYPTRRVVAADGVVSMVGCLMGNPFINAVYIGHPGWKAMGGRIGYSVLTGFTTLLLAWIGLLPLLLSIIPIESLLPILLYIGLLIGAQAFQHSPAKHAPAIVLALVPHLAAWAKNQVDATLAAVGTNATDVGMDRLEAAGVLYHGLETLGGGAIITSIIWAGISISIIDGNSKSAAIYAMLGACLSFLGVIHSEQLAWAASFSLTAAYALVAAVLFYPKDKISDRPLDSGDR